jgi:GntR family transcriptional regulator
MPATKGPSYHEVAADLRSKIRRGEYPAGSRLPTREQLCDLYGVSNQTVDSAKILLRAEGLIVDRRKAGTIVADPLPEGFITPPSG